MSIFGKLRNMIGGDEGDETQASRASTPAARRPHSSVPEPVTIPEITSQQLIAAMEAGEPLVLLDVRQPWDHEAQHPRGSVPLPLNELPARLSELDKEQRYVLSCYHGFTSQQGVAFLMEQGFTNVASLEGGFSGWAAAGLPVEGKYANDEGTG